jgi:predicted amidohydrolase
MKVVDDKDINIDKAVNMIETSARNKADVVVLPEMFNCPYESGKFSEYAECLDNGKTMKSISRAAREFGVHIIAGSIPEISGGRIYNTCVVFDDNGDIIGKHRKVHLFDISIPGKIEFKESDTLGAGNGITVVETRLCKIGIAICYDVRFPELFRLMALKGAQIIVVPAAFNMTTGPVHWELLMRTRAVDNQIFVAAVSPARDENAAYVAYGNSMVVDPWANILTRLDGEENIVYSDLDLSQITRIRNELPLIKHRRTDMYDLYEK